MRQEVPAFAYAVKLVLALPYLPPKEVRSGYNLIVDHLDVNIAVSLQVFSPETRTDFFLLTLILTFLVNL